MRPGRPGTPRFQRYLNRCFLLDLQEQLTGFPASDQLFDSDPEAKFVNIFGRSATSSGDDVVDHDMAYLDDTFFSDVVSDSEAQRRWAPFVCIDIDDQADLIASLGSSCPQTPPKYDLFKKRPHTISNKYWEPLRKSSRNPHFWNFVCCLEVYLAHYLSVIGDLESTTMEALQAMVNETRFVEEGETVPFSLHLAMDGKNRFPMLILSLETSFHRLLCHALSSYYQVVSESCDAPDGSRLTQIRIGKSLSALPRGWEPSMPKTTLAAYLVRSRDCFGAPEMDVGSPE